MQTCVSKIKKDYFKIKTCCKLELLFSKTMKLLGSAKKDIDQDKNGENVPKLVSRFFSTL